MVCVVRVGRYRIYVFAEIGGRHDERHCHIYWPDGSAAVALETGDVLAGRPLPRRARELYAENEDAIARA